MKRSTYISKWLPLVLGALCVGYFGFHATWGDRGLLATRHLQERTAERQLRLAELEADRVVLQRRVGLLSGPAIDADILDEQVRKTLGWSRPGEIVIMGTD
ncbi:MAG: septum formation initiator family protein [Minwuia sp.]|nr:septum formation initiator family protein [Minwuia sp.]